jgi:hypothetical protein
LATAVLSYENVDYEGDAAVSDREDKRGTIGFDLKYTLTNWLAMSGGYSFVKRDSTNEESEYDRNNVYLNLVFSL